MKVNAKKNGKQDISAKDRREDFRTILQNNLVS